MPYRRNNYNYVVEPSFQPFTMQEMLVPFTAYKDAFEKTEEAYNDLAEKADTFKYLEDYAKEHPDSKAAQIYKGYADELHEKLEDFGTNGLTMGNRRSLTNLKRRYQGEIGRIAQADKELKKELELRRAMGAKDPSMLYANENLNIDSYLDGNTPNLYGISGTDLYSRGATLGKAISSRMHTTGEGAGNVLGGLYKTWVERYGVSQENIAAFMNNPEVLKQVDNILAERGVLDNLTGNNLAKARQSLLNGIYEGIVYQESIKPIRDENVFGASEKLKLRLQGFDTEGNYHEDWDAERKKAEAITKAKAQAKANGTTSSGTSSSGYTTLNEQGVRLQWKGNNPNDTNGDADNDMEDPRPLENDEAYIGQAVNYDELPTFVKEKVKRVINNLNKGDENNYIFYYKPYKESFWGDDEAAVDIVPRKVIKDEDDEADFSSMYGTIK